MENINKLNYSYWEKKYLFFKYDLIVIGSGIVGLSTAISFKEKNKKAKILILEKGILPNGASFKNAGFACFGSVSELIDDFTKMPEKTVLDTIEMRWQGLKILRKRLGDKNLDFKHYGGYELFNSKTEYKICSEKINHFNSIINNLLGKPNCYSIIEPKKLPFNNISGVIFNKYEGQIDSGRMLNNLINLARQFDITILNGICVSEINSHSGSVELLTSNGVFNASKVIVATNGFVNQLLKIKDVNPARAQVLITKPIKNLNIKGTFHYQQGYYYFRNIDNRILLGGGRNLDFKKETTTSEGLNLKIQTQLDELLRNIILPNTSYEVDYRWSGIMGVGSEKKPIIKIVQPNVLAAVRMGGMGIAIGSLVGKLAAKEID
jgi:glycine/D-amino acid oxidase-like deaminating enzyme